MFYKIRVHGQINPHMLERLSNMIYLAFKTTENVRISILKVERLIRQHWRVY